MSCLVSHNGHRVVLYLITVCGLILVPFLVVVREYLTETTWEGKNLFCPLISKNANASIMESMMAGLRRLQLTVNSFTSQLIGSRVFGQVVGQSGTLKGPSLVVFIHHIGLLSRGSMTSQDNGTCWNQCSVWLCQGHFPLRSLQLL